MEKVLFICTGNTCRSPMAEAILKHYGNHKFEVQSAGLFSNEGQRANPYAIEALKQKNIEIHHQSQQLSEGLINWATCILTMTQQHKQTITMQFPEAIDKTFTLKEYVLDRLSETSFWEKWQKTISEREEALLAYKQIVKDKNKKEEDKNKAFDRLRKAEEHVKTLEEEVPNLDINDPFGSDLQEYQLVCREIEELILQWMGKLS